LKENKFHLVISALHHSVVKKNIEICELILKNKKFDATVRSFEGLTALFVAIVSNVDYEIIELIVKSKKELVNERNNEEVSPLHEAVKNRRIDIVKLLIENGANVNSYDLDLENALHYAASNCDYDMITYLLNETEIDPSAKNRDDMNPICLLLVRSRNEPSDIVLSCFHFMLEHTYEKDTFTNNYKVEDLFQAAFLATVYSHTEIVKFIIHNIYSKNNSKYEFIKRLCDSCEVDEDEEFLYYLLVFFHDKINRYDKFSFPRFSEINYFMGVRAVVYVVQKLLETNDSVILAISLLEEIKTIGINIRVREFEDQIGVLVYERFSNCNYGKHHIDNVSRLLEYFYEKNFNINTTVKSVLHSTAVAKESHPNIINSTIEILSVLLPFTTTFFTDQDCWKQINEFKNLNENIRTIVMWLNENYGNAMTNSILDVKIIYSLKHICRNVIRENLGRNLRLLQNHSMLLKIGLPDILVKYLEYKH
jgi:ankyrin repeat protein